MGRLSATDAFFAYADTPAAPMNMGSVQILKLPNGYRGNFFDDYKRFVGRRIEYLPKLKKRLVDDHVGLPYWVDDPDFKLDDHVRHTSVRTEDDERALSRKLGRLQLTPFEPAKPPFMFYVIDGLKDGRVALLQKYHHAIADGKTAVRMMDLFSDEGLERARRDEDMEVEQTPGPIQRLLSGAVEDARRTFISLPGLVGAARKMSGEGGREMLDRMQSRPITRFNQPLSKNRLFACRNWPLEDINKVRRAAGLTFNDLGLVLLGGALRRYLDELDALPEESLICNVPVAIDLEGVETGNAVLATYIPMGTHLEDRQQRIQFVKDAASVGKDFISGVAEGASSGQGVQLPSYLVKAMAMYTSSDWMTRRMPPPANVSMSNVPAPTEPIHVAGAKVESLYGLPMILQGLAVSTTFSSYAGQAVSSILCCQTALPDPERIHDYMQNEFDLLKKTYVRPARRTGRKGN